MVFPIAGGNESKGYEISNSLRFNDGDSPKLEFTPSSTGNRRTFTFSFWFKRSTLGTSQYFFYTDNNGSGSTDFLIYIGSNDKFSIGFLDSSQKYLITNRVFRDVSAWYHAVVAVDTTQSTASNRIKIYINGVEETSFGTDNRSDLGQNTELDFSRQAVHRISGYSSTAYIDGYLTEYHVVDGTAKAQTDFGKFDGNGVWIPKKYSGSYGTNGFFLEFKQTGTSANSSGIGADTSGQDNHFAATNLAATDVTEDTCTNNFATINSLANYFNPATLSEGNTRVDFDNGTSTVYNISTIGVSSGKWYCEIKAVTIPDYAEIGIASRPCIAGGNSDKLTVNQYNYGYTANNGNVKSNSSGGSSYGNTYDDGDIIGIALDLDNNKLYFSKNGTFQNSGDPTSGSTGTGAVSIQAPSGTIDGVYYFAVGDNRNGHDTRMDCNFGNPAYANSSGNADANGYGDFEYAPPSGYYALCTKNLAEFG